MRKFIFTILIIVCAQGFSAAQGYITAAGLRYSGSNDVNSIGITIQQRIKPKLTIELITEWRQKDPILTALFQYHKPLLFKGFNVYAGIGGHTNLADLDLRENINNFRYGFNGVLGAELRLPFFPLVLSADFMPELNKIKDPVQTNPKDWNLIASTNLSVRYVLYSDKMKRKRLKKKKKKARQEGKIEKQEERDKEKTTKQEEREEQKTINQKEREEKKEEIIDTIKDKEKRKQWWDNLKNKLPKIGKKEPATGT